ncbi:hypothetical protein HCH_04243 [Hahella chejuensis KCTC 2396]|uniref:Uncharacterized protein n=1 Tax=Hahella chejuensis (strain KCTC 2396) TaxID=349521 RepID=Q2SEH4_HAHCH|nr:hypothetical protein HCH_04243 [Hahella chejuensis KCTC 2396]
MKLTVRRYYFSSDDFRFTPGSSGFDAIVILIALPWRRLREQTNCLDKRT